MLTTTRRMAGLLALATLTAAPVWASDATTRRAALQQTQTRIDEVQARIHATPQDTDQAQAMTAAVQKILDAAASFQAKGQARMAKIHADLADGMLQANQKLLALPAAAATSGAQQ